MTVVFWLSLVFLVYVWFIYPVFVTLLARIRIEKTSLLVYSSALEVSVIVAAHNEADNLAERIENIYASDYPGELIEVVVALDGSTDNSLVLLGELSLRFPRLRWIDINPQGGRANAHNRAYQYASGEILVFTDAETAFDPDFINNITTSFNDPSVGFVSGVLRYRNVETNEITASVGLYWRLELWLREHESKLGLYVLGSGACCAVRKKLYCNIPSTGDVDFTTPLDVVKTGSRCMHVSDAIAYDVLPDSKGREFRARVRMTAKNLAGTLGRWGLKGLTSHPLYSLVLFSHKIGRWLTPLGFIGLLVSSVLLVGIASWVFPVLLVQLVFYTLALAGYLRLRIPLASQAFSFLLANAAFLLGIGKAILGRVPKAYKPMGQT